MALIVGIDLGRKNAHDVILLRRETAQQLGRAFRFDTTLSGIAVNTLRNFYQVLEDTFVGLRISPFASGRRRVVKVPRFVFFDIGLRHVLAELPTSETLLEIDPGTVFEQWVLTELYYRCQYRGRGYALSTWRTPTGVEVDAIVETPDELIPIEIKWTDKPRAADGRHIEKFMDLHPDKSSKGFVVCRAPHTQQLSARVTALPWDEF